jgi:hypothetical protein
VVAAQAKVDDAKKAVDDAKADPVKQAADEANKLAGNPTAADGLAEAERELREAKDKDAGGAAAAAAPPVSPEVAAAQAKVDDAQKAVDEGSNPTAADDLAKAEQELEHVTALENAKPLHATLPTPVFTVGHPRYTCHLPVIDNRSGWTYVSVHGLTGY